MFVSKSVSNATDVQRSSSRRQRMRGLFTLPFVLLVFSFAMQAQHDPGIRAGQAGAGDPIGGLAPGESDFFFNQGKPQFTQVEAVGDGLGPRFNLDSCGGCHIQPDVGGSSPPVNNPQVFRASTMAPGNTVPSFLSLNGPVREARFVRNPDGTPDGGVHDLFTIAGRGDKPTGCAISQPDFQRELNNHNIIFRIPTPVFGAGLIEAITDTTIRRNLASDPLGRKASFGITGHVNTNGNDGTVTRFGWKAQNKSLLIFAGEAYNVEMGITNENFTNEREEDPKCAANGTPENHSGFNVGSTLPADIVAFMGFMKFLDQPAPACTGIGCSESIRDGRELFSQVGCASCHTPTLVTGLSSTLALNKKPANLFSDIAVHHMGTGLADGVTQGTAGPDEFRTAPLWGVGQRAFFLHDGRTSDLLQAILAHDSSGSEAARVTEAFEALSASQKQNILNFLRSL
jgi:CxxC motif-containing protein (DUF1111 family)